MVVEAKNINQQRCFKLRERGSVGWCDVSKCGHLLKEQYVNYIYRQFQNTLNLKSILMCGFEKS